MSRSQLLLENPVVSSVISGDFDGDGKQDLPVGVVTQVDGNDFPILDTTGVYTMKDNGDFTFRLPDLYAASTYPLDGRFVDLNGDGRPDLIIVEAAFCYYTSLQNGNFVPLINLSCGAFAQGLPAFTLQASGGHAFVADFNGDGAGDALTLSQFPTQHSPM